MASFPTAASSAHRSIDLRAAAVSIIGFWLFYCAVVTVRAALMGFENQMEMLGRRTVVTLAGMALTFALYLALRPFDGRPLRQRVAAAALLTLPVAALFAAFNYAAFYVYQPMETDQVVIVQHPANEAAPVRNRWGEEVKIEETEQEAAKTMRPLGQIADGTVTWYFFFAAWAAFHLAVGYAADVRRAERQAAAYRAAARDAEIRALRYQVNPHFLFNTLNSLSTLVLRNRPEEAERMILNLSTFFRTSLTAGAADDLALSEEIRLQRLYLDIEAVRFPERLRVEIDVPDELGDACIPGLLLQPLVENAIKHGVSRASRPVTLTLRARQEEPGRLTVSVIDNGPSGEADSADPLTAQRPAGTGTGLRNVRQRLAARFGDDAEIKWGPRPVEGFAVTVDLPLARHGC
jgi:two-component system, LytTR family, sensor kinase